MNETEWLNSTDPAAMLREFNLHPTSMKINKFPCPSNRKLRLFSDALHEATGHDSHFAYLYLAFSEPPSGVWLREGEQWSPSIDALSRAIYPEDFQVAAALLRDIFNPFRPGPECWWCKGDGQASHDPDYGACTVCGGSGYSLPRGQRTPNVLAVARTIYDERRWSETPILADALEEAGCDNDDLLMHCRGKERCLRCDGKGKFFTWDPASSHMVDPKEYDCHHCKGTGWIPLRGPHCRGCWALDLILGKE